MLRPLVLVACLGCAPEPTTDAPEPEGATSGTPSSPSTPVPDEPPDGTDPAAEKDAASVFFSGHSLINLNTPAFFSQLAEGAGRTVDYELQMGLGSPMSVRLACPLSGQQADGGPIAYDLFEELGRAGAYDTLLVTERHDILGTILWEHSTAMARHFRDAFLVGAPDGQPLLFESWYTIDTADPQAFRDRAERELVAWQCIASKVNESRVGEPMLVVPAGQMIAELVGAIVDGTAPGLTDLDQLFVDDVHLTPEGDYLIALLHYAVAYRRSPAELAHEGLVPLFGASPSMSAETAAYLQDLAGRHADRTWAEAADSQRADADCEALLFDLCEAEYGVGDWSCTQIAAAFDDDTAPIPVITDDWCLR